MGRALGGAERQPGRQDQRRAGLVDEDAVGLVDDGEHQAPEQAVIGRAAGGAQAVQHRVQRAVVHLTATRMGGGGEAQLMQQFLQRKRQPQQQQLVGQQHPVGQVAGECRPGRWQHQQGAAHQRQPQQRAGPPPQPQPPADMAVQPGPRIPQAAGRSCRPPADPGRRLCRRRLQPGCWARSRSSCRPGCCDPAPGWSRRRRGWRCHCSGTAAPHRRWCWPAPDRPGRRG